MHTEVPAAQAGARRRLTEPRLIALAAVFAALEGYDLASYGATVPSLLQDHSIAATKAPAVRTPAAAAIMGQCLFGFVTSIRNVVSNGAGFALVG